MGKQKSETSVEAPLAKPFWSRVEHGKEANGDKPYLAELKEVPGGAAYGATEAQAHRAALELGCEVLGQRGTVRGGLLAEWLAAMTQGGRLPHSARCKAPGKGQAAWLCHEDCLVLRTQEALRGDATVTRPAIALVRAQKPEAA